MTAIEIKEMEIELIREIDNDESLLEAALTYIRNLKTTIRQSPCQFTAEEKEIILLKGESDAKKSQGTLHEDLKKEFVSW